MDDFDANRERGDKQTAAAKWKQAEDDLKKLREELQNSPAEQPDTGEEIAPGTRRHIERLEENKKRYPGNR